MAILPPDKDQVRREAILAAKRKEAEELAALETIYELQRSAGAALAETLEHKKLLEEELVLDKELGKRIRDLRKVYNDFVIATEAAQGVYAQVTRDLEIKKAAIATAGHELSELDVKITKAKAALEGLLAKISELEPKPVVLEKQIIDLIEERNALEKNIIDRKGDIELEEADLATKRKYLAEAQTTLKIYDNRLQSEYARIFPNVAYKSPFNEKKEN